MGCGWGCQRQIREGLTPRQHNQDTDPSGGVFARPSWPWSRLTCLRTSASSSSPPWVAGIVAYLLRQPLIVGYILGGILVSPFTPGPQVSNPASLRDICRYWRRSLDVLDRRRVLASGVAQGPEGGSVRRSRGYYPDHPHGFPHGHATGLARVAKARRRSDDQRVQHDGSGEIPSRPRRGELDPRSDRCRDRAPYRWKSW